MTHPGGKASPPIAEEAPAFDQRPGTLEATRGLMDGRHAMLIGSRHDDSWRAMVYAPRALDAGEMRDLAKRLNLMANYFEGLGGW